MVSPGALEDVACCLCGSAETRPFFSAARVRASGTDLPPIAECVHCGLVYVTPRPTAAALRSLYDESYFRSPCSIAHGYDDYLAQQALLAPTFRRRIEYVQRLRDGLPGRYLDVGCAAGFSVEAAAALGWDAQGVDISAWACEAGRSRGLRITTGELSDAAARIGRECLDLVSMWDYIEHVQDPVGEVRCAYDLLAADGHLAVATPDLGSLPARLAGPRWMGIKPKEHLFYFTRRAMRRILEQSGFEIVSSGHAGKYITLSFFVERLGHYFPRVSGTVASLFATMGLARRSIYVVPYDIMLIVARKSSRHRQVLDAARTAPRPSDSAA